MCLMNAWNYFYHHSEDFEKFMLNMIRKQRAVKTVKARELLEKIFRIQIETGTSVYAL